MPAGFVRACGEAVEELRQLRKTLEADNILIDRQTQLLQLEREISTQAKNINSLSATEIESLRKALTAKDAVIAATEAQVAVLKRNQVTIWKKAKWFILGGAAGIIAGAVLTK